jgi:hypothetical protein
MINIWVYFNFIFIVLTFRSCAMALVYSPLCRKCGAEDETSSVPSGVWCGGFKPPEIPKFWQSRAEFPVPWKIHLQQPNKITGFTHLQIEQNTSLGSYCPQIPILSALCPQLSLLTPSPPTKKFLGTPLDETLAHILLVWSVGFAYASISGLLLSGAREY